MKLQKFFGRVRKKQFFSQTKGDISIQMIIVGAIALIVLVVMIIIFRQQVGRTSGTFFDIFSGSVNQAEKGKCESLLSLDRKCASDSPIEGKWTRIDIPKGGWSDCDTICWKKENP